MASVIPREVKKEQVDAWLAETWKVGLLKNTFVGQYVAGTHVNWTDVSAFEIAASGSYVAGGATLTRYAWGVESTGYTGTDAAIDAVNSAFTTITATARFVVVYNAVAPFKIRAIYELPADYPVTGGTFTIQWNASGLIKVSQA
jgi:hypothetical protein